jgi:hypothetical protein
MNRREFLRNSAVVLIGAWLGIKGGASQAEQLSAPHKVFRGRVVEASWTTPYDLGDLRRYGQCEAELSRPMVFDYMGNLDAEAIERGTTCSFEVIGQPDVMCLLRNMVCEVANSGARVRISLPADIPWYVIGTLDSARLIDSDAGRKEFCLDLVNVETIATT